MLQGPLRGELKVAGCQIEVDPVIAAIAIGTQFNDLRRGNLRLDEFRYLTKRVVLSVRTDVEDAASHHVFR